MRPRARRLAGQRVAPLQAAQGQGVGLGVQVEGLLPKIEVKPSVEPGRRVLADVTVERFQMLFAQRWFVQARQIQAGQQPGGTVRARYLPRLDVVLFGQGWVLAQQREVAEVN